MSSPRAAGRHGAHVLGAFAAGLFLAACSRAAPAALAPPVASYRIDASYDQPAQTLRGRQTLTWRNPTREAATDLYFHLYLNAFANSRSSFMRGVDDVWPDWARDHPDGWGYTTVTAIRIGGEDITARMQFVHPDDDNIDDRTVFRLPLPSPVRAGASVDVDVEFISKLPKVFARSGYAGPFAFVAQWFPKIGVYEAGAWNCHQYHATTEFFADFGTYDVTLTVPREGIVGATGLLRETRENPDGTRTLRFVAEDVHDFAWTYDPRFHVIEQSHGPTQLRLLLQPNHATQAPRYLAAVRTALDRYREWIGEYPYAQLTIVDPGAGGIRAGGMEYPMLITVGAPWWVPESVRLPEVLAIHEFGHQYWYGMLANNEFEEAWLDEGVNTYLEGKIMDAAYGPGSYLSVLGVRADGIALHRLRYLATAHTDPMTRYAWRFLDRSSYTATSYAKTALVLDTLERQVGEERLRRALAAYAQRWRFRHPRGRDFLATVEEALGEDLSWYFDQVVPETGVLDYAVTRVAVEEAHPPTGYPFVNGRPGDVVPPVPPAETQYRSEVVVERLGVVRMPVDVQIVFEDGSITAERWDGRERWRRFEFTGARRVEWAVIDPQLTQPLDVNRLNNSRMCDGGTRGIARLAGRWAVWFQNLVAAATGL